MKILLFSKESESGPREAKKKKSMERVLQRGIGWQTHMYVITSLDSILCAINYLLEVGGSNCPPGAY